MLRDLRKWPKPYRDLHGNGASVDLFHLNSLIVSLICTSILELYIHPDIVIPRCKGSTLCWCMKQRQYADQSILHVLIPWPRKCHTLDPVFQFKWPVAGIELVELSHQTVSKVS